MVAEQFRGDQTDPAVSPKPTTGLYTDEMSNKMMTPKTPVVQR